MSAQRNRATFGCIPFRLFVAGLIIAGAFGAPAAYGGMKEGLEAARAGNFEKALSEWLPLAREGNPAAAYDVAQLYRRGQGVKQDFAQAARWYRVAAERSHPVAQYNLAVLYTIGRGVPVDMAEARHWYRSAGEQGYAAAQYNLAVLYASGKGGPVDMVQAYLWFELAATKGHKEAAKARDEIAAKMPKPQLDAAKALVRDWQEKRKGKKQG